MAENERHVKDEKLLSESDDGFPRNTNDEVIASSCIEELANSPEKTNRENVSVTLSNTNLQSDDNQSVEILNAVVQSHSNDQTDNCVRAKLVEMSEDVRKFVEGEEIVDKENPFRGPRVIQRQRSNRKKISFQESDFITKEEILKQSKCVPVYVKHPDAVLQYDRTIIDDFVKPRKPAIKPKPKPPYERKVSVEEIKRRRARLQNASKYPDLSDIKVS